MGSLLTPLQYAKGFAFELTPKEFEYNGGMDWAAFNEAQAHFSYLNMENYMDVKDRFGNVVPFKLNKVQKMMMKKKLEQLRQYGFCRIYSLKVRQCGSSTVWSRDLLVNAKLRNFGCSIVAHVKEGTAERSIFTYVTDALEKWKWYEKHGIFIPGFTATDNHTKNYLAFTSGGKIQVVRANPSAVGTTNQYVLISEASRIPNYPDFWESISPSLPKGNHSTCIVESTARYTGPYFFNRWKEQWDYEKETGEIPIPRSIFIPCYMVEEYCAQPLPEDYTWDTFWSVRSRLKKKRIDPDELYGPEELLTKKKWWDYYDEIEIELPLNFWYWRRLTIDEQEAESGSGFRKLHWFNQNYPMTPEEAELIAGDAAFPRSEIQKHRLMIEIPSFTGDIKYDEKKRTGIPDDTVRRTIYQEWDNPQRGLNYFLFLDPANEKQGDYWAALVYSPAQFMFTAMLRMNNATTQEVLCRLTAMGYRWNTALLGWEANLVKISDTILLKLLGKDFVNPPGVPYPNIYKRVRFDSHKKRKVMDDPQYGFWLANNKNDLIQIWMDAICNREFLFYQKEILDELWFMRKHADKDGYLKRSPSAPKGKNDDLIIAGGGAMFMAREMPDRWDLMRQRSELNNNYEDDPYDKYLKSFAKYQKERRRNEMETASIARGYARKY